MNRDTVHTALWAGILGTILSIGSILSLVTGFSLPLGNLHRLIFLWTGTAFCCGILFQLPRGRGLFLLVSTFFFGYLWQLGTPYRQALQLLGYIGEFYNQAYHWNLPIPTGHAALFDDPLLLWGCVISLSVSFWVCRGKCFPLVLAAVLLSLVPCFVVTDTVPATPFLILVMAGLGILFLTAAVRKKSICQANRLTAATFLPILIVFSVLMLLNPRSEYTNRSEPIRQKLFQLAQTVPTRLEQAVITLSSRPSDKVSLDTLGPQNPSSRHVLTVTAPTSGALYLRGKDYDGYTGTEWSCDSSRTETFTAPQESTNTVIIQTVEVLDFYYLPYYPSQHNLLLGGKAPNLERATQYTVQTGSLSETPQSSATAEDIYLTLPQRPDYSALLDSILQDTSASTRAKAAAIADYVRSSAVYDLNTGSMPREETDFVLWFLEDAQRGYCIHFATAAAVLLRAAGIPARYVTGFLVQTQAEKSVTVTQKDAHAWVEYFDPQLHAWLILDATPAASGGASTTPEGSQAAAESTVPPPTASRELAQVLSQPLSVPPQDTMNFPLLAVAAFLLLAIAGQRRVRIALRRRKQLRGHPNGQAMARWQEALLLSRLLKQIPEGNLLELAQKAKFSPHDLSEEELNCFDAYLRFCRLQLAKKPWYIRWIHQYIYAAY